VCAKITSEALEQFAEDVVRKIILIAKNRKKVKNEKGNTVYHHFR